MDKLKEMYIKDKELLEHKDNIIGSILQMYRKPNFSIIQSTIIFLEPLNISFIKLIKEESYKWLPLPDLEKYLKLVAFIYDRIGD